MYGFQVGYNHQFLRRFVGGFEADFHVARGASDLTLNSLTGAATVPFTPLTIAPGFGVASTFGGATTIATNFAASQEMRYFGTLRARLGWLPWDPVLIYATAGLAYARITSTTVVTQQCLGVCGGVGLVGSPGTVAISPAYGTSTNWRAGVTFGSGIEVALGGGVSIKGDFLYYKFGNWTYDLTPLQATTAGSIPFFATGVTATTRNFNGSRWIVGLNYNFGAPDEALDRRP